MVLANRIGSQEFTNSVVHPGLGVGGAARPECSQDDLCGEWRSGHGDFPDDDVARLRAGDVLPGRFFGPEGGDRHS
ncbi:protein of unknown function [Kyrpidia spormannii]|uniref:Uncharacterized protein n=1 Tax=Kyrpidia spormannii TaxID=2055160 RepID=A0A6F9EB44_9BACL|nr:protein of unknown function [Kyrpidia spormannii]